MQLTLRRFLILLLGVVTSASCAVIVERELDQKWGEERVQDRRVAEVQPGIPEYHRDIQPIFDKRCVTCHACYDGPCQLKLSRYDGLDRGASKELVYDGARLLAIQPSRLGVDEKTTQGWRERDYFPVLNERNQIPEANLYGSLLYQMLALKRRNPLPEGPVLDSKTFDFSTSRDQECPTIAEFDSYAQNHPQWGMPFGLPAISDEDFDTVKRWVEAGSPVKPLPEIGSEYLNKMKQWEEFFNGASNKERLFARYAYEHLYLANLWFDSLGNTQYFKLVRSRTPMGEPIDEIASRRPFDDPGTDTFFYRLKPVRSTIVDKTHMPYVLSEDRMTFWRSLFLEPDYDVPALPSYEPSIASNPFITFKHLPVSARYRFMLEEAEYTIMGYIKGPVCRGQVALNVIEDHFWVMFVDPEVPTMMYDPARVEKRADHLRLPSAEESNASPLAIWTRYSRLQEKHLKDKLEHINRFAETGPDISLNLLWDGDGHNQNAALTVFRHFDNATVVKGFHGPKPKTAWVITYSLLERIHYLLVAGFDVYGNLGHQLNTRLYMDFLRMEGESNFLMFLPEEDAQREFLSWYQGAEEEVDEYLNLLRQAKISRTAMQYQSDETKSELFDKLFGYFGEQILPDQPVLPEYATRSFDGLDEQLDELAALRGKSLQHLPELSMVRVKFEDGQQHVFTLAVNRYHKNVSSLFMEEQRLLPDRYTASLYPGILGSYPNAFFDVHVLLFEHFVDRLSSLKSEADYRLLLDDFGVRRTDPKFWDYADWLNVWYLVNQPMKAGIVDLNRFENR